MNNELIAVLDYLERDRGIDREVLTEVIEDALVSAARKALGPVNDLRVKVNPQTGDIQAIAQLTVVEQVRATDKEIDLEVAQEKYPNVSLGDDIEWEVTPENFGRIAAQTAKQGILHRLRQAERLQIERDYQDQIGTLIHGVIVRHDRGDVIVKLGRAEAALRHQDRIPGEDYQVGDHVCCILAGVDIERHGPILLIDRTNPLLITRLFEREVSEINEGVVEIKGVAREPGHRSKIAVHSEDPKVDPVGACVGVRGSRVKAIVRELNGEKVDIIRWDPRIQVYVENALQPAKIQSIAVDEDNHVVTVSVHSDQLSLAIGKRGQNIRLTSKLTEWKVDIDKIEEKKEADFAEKLQQAIDALVTALGIAPETAQLLAHNGFLTLEGVNAADESDIAAIEGIDPEMAQAIKQAACSTTESTV